MVCRFRFMKKTKRQKAFEEKHYRSPYLNDYLVERDARDYFRKRFKGKRTNIKRAAMFLKEILKEYKTAKYGNYFAATTWKNGVEYNHIRKTYRIFWKFF